MSPCRRRGRPATVLAVVVAVAALVLPSAAGAASAMRTELSEIESEVMCPVCGTLLELAESPQATREKAFVEKLVKQGQSEDEIKNAPVAQYGDAVLAQGERDHGDDHGDDRHHVGGESEAAALRRSGNGEGRPARVRSENLRLRARARRTASASTPTSPATTSSRKSRALTKQSPAEHAPNP